LFRIVEGACSHGVGEDRNTGVVGSLDQRQIPVSLTVVQNTPATQDQQVQP
jgi:hypothetical protein